MIGQTALPFFAALCRGCAVRLTQRVRAAIASMWFAPGRLVDQQFLRYVHYRAIERVLRDRYGDGAGIRAIEFGSSNEIVRRALSGWTYEIAPNYPAVDVHDLSAYGTSVYDVVVLDQVVEHVRDPRRVVSEVHRILRDGGVCIATTPFLIEVHGSPDDFWRFTASGLRELFAGFSSISVDGWGNRFTVNTIARYGWLSCRYTRRLLAVALWNEPEWPIDFLTIAVK
jgi:SAM-dependent methyltransferase